MNADIYLLCTSGRLCRPSIRGPFDLNEAEKYISFDALDDAPGYVVAKLSAEEAAGMLMEGKYLDLTETGLVAGARKGLAA